MTSLSSICFETEVGDHIVLCATGFRVDPLRVLVMTEADYRQAMKSGGKTTDNSWAIPILSSDAPTVQLTMPSAGKWRIVYQTGDADTVTVEVVAAPR